MSEFERNETEIAVAHDLIAVDAGRAITAARFLRPAGVLPAGLACWRQLQISAIAALLLGGLNAQAIQPAIQRFDPGVPVGSALTCEGHVFLAQASGSPATDCKKQRPGTVCTHLGIETCPIAKGVDYVNCTAVSLPKADFDSITTAPGVNEGSDMDIALELERLKIKREDPSFVPKYNELRLLKVGRKPVVRVTGRLAGCSECAECFPRTQCDLTACVVQRR